jgi:hypothetical protein
VFFNDRTPGHPPTTVPADRAGDKLLQEGPTVRRDGAWDFVDWALFVSLQTDEAGIVVSLIYDIGRLGDEDADRFLLALERAAVQGAGVSAGATAGRERSRSATAPGSRA